MAQTHETEIDMDPEILEIFRSSTAVSGEFFSALPGNYTTYYLLVYSEQGCELKPAEAVGPKTKIQARDQGGQAARGA